MVHTFFEESRKYQLIQYLGAGSFGCVALARDAATGELVAIKQLEREFVRHHYVCAEILNHSRLSHPHVVAFRSVFLTGRDVNIVMEFVSGGSLLPFVQRRGRLEEPLARWFFQQLVLAVDYCHRKGVANRDIKLDNLLLQPLTGLPRPLLKVCDFGYSKSEMRRCEAHARVGTLSYMPPEIMDVESAISYDAAAVDVWCCGVCLYAMLTGRMPFPAPGRGLRGEALARAVAGARRAILAGGGARLPPEAGVSAGCEALIRRMLEPRPERRATVPDILSDPWFLVELPPNALTMNEHYLSLPPATKQSEEEIRGVVAAVRGSDSGDDSLERVSVGSERGH
ncbi:sulfur stress regulator [Raphidocelis subcapitata]|uniref:Sulfur stress regulator n=1 Tax=Raphidocelis subcapitata TaxID=307507 RepID=A0A2V0PHK0_9CHLO|nr:sulfur stress regulator [Raphidocelis subcapitata]|eukprot:GBF96707.1 sulfur stress regulator [Raphidocelis subcapitata]